MKGDAFLILIAASLAGWWLLSLAWHPFAACGRCKDRRGRNLGSKSGRWGRCGKCGGRGERQRFGARAVRKGIGRPL